MTALEQLRPFISLCQACGMIPYVMEYDSITKKFVRFTFSFKYFTTWWFLFVALLQLSAPLMLTNITIATLKEMSNDLSLPITAIILTGVNSVGSFTQMAMCRWIGFRYCRLRNAVNAILNAEKLYVKPFFEHKNSIKKRFVIGTALIFIMSTGLMIIMGSIVPSFLPASYKMDLLPSILVFFVFGLMFTMMGCSILLIHLSYYVVSHYLSLVYSNKKDDVLIPCKIEVQSFHDRRKHPETLCRNSKIFYYLCQASYELNCVFSIPVLLTLVLRLVSAVTISFVLIHSIIQANQIFRDSALAAMPFLLVFDWAFVLIILSSADMPVYQVRLLRERVISMLHSGSTTMLSNKLAEMSFLKQIDEDRVRLSAAGLFKVGIHLIPSILGAVVTYMVVLLQN